MKSPLLTLCFLLLLSGTMFAQEPAKRPIPRLQKIDIASSGCAVYMPSNLEFNKSKSDDGSEVYTGDIIFDDFHYAIICVKFAANIPSKEDQINVLTGYMDFLQGQFGIISAAGYGKGHTLESNPEAAGIIDYWVDEDEFEWAVKGWVDGDHLAILCLYGLEEHPYFNVQQMFLDGFRFPKK